MKTDSIQYPVTKIEIPGWVCNGSINPLIRSEAELLKVITGTVTDGSVDEAFDEAVRWTKIHMQCHTSRELWDVWEKQTPSYILSEYFKMRAVPLWKTIERKAPFTMEIATIAQMVAKHGGTDSRAAARDFEDLLQCLTLVGQYNDFEPVDVRSVLQEVNRKQFYNPSNPNNGKDIFKYHVAWEGSFALYVTMSPMFDKRVLTPDWRGWEPYDAASFDADMQVVKEAGGPDEFDLTSETETRRTYRFWWD